jgi:threonine dehydratase
MPARAVELPDRAIEFGDVERAAARLKGVAHRTPLLTSSTLDERVGGRVFLKAETFQRMGAFKFRGAYNAVSSLSADELQRGVCAVSSGNHAQATALA